MLMYLTARTFAETNISDMVRDYLLKMDIGVDAGNDLWMLGAFIV